jgi:hypothetical protein
MKHSETSAGIKIIEDGICKYDEMALYEFLVDETRSQTLKEIRKFIEEKLESEM